MRLIDAEALLELFDKECARECDNCVYYEKCIGHQYCGLIDNAPTIEGTAEWEYTDGRWGLGDWRCSKCGGYSNKDTHYCPNCGARMEKVTYDRLGKARKDRADM